MECSKTETQADKASWRKLRIAVNQERYIEGCELTDRFGHDDQQVGPLLKQITESIDHFPGDGAYDEPPVYETVIEHSPTVDVVVPPRKNTIINEDAAGMRNRNISEIKASGRVNWQRNRGYGRRNVSELWVQRYQRILGNTLHARDSARQKQEAMLGCGVLNKMTSLGMPQSYR